MNAKPQTLNPTVNAKVVYSIWNGTRMTDFTRSRGSQGGGGPLLGRLPDVTQDRLRVWDLA